MISPSKNIITLITDCEFIFIYYFFKKSFFTGLYIYEFQILFIFQILIKNNFENKQATNYIDKDGLFIQQST